MTATKALEVYWSSAVLARSTRDKGELIRDRLERIAAGHDGVSARGRGMAQGLKFEDADRAGAVCKAAFDRGVLMETSGPQDEVVKLLPPLTTSHTDLNAGLDILSESVAAATD